MVSESLIPKHVAVIMDGNGRWAERRGRPRVFGHIRGASRVKSIVERADQQGIQALTLFAFSTENWSRPDSELKVLWRLLKKYLRREVAHLESKNVRLRVIGETDRLPPDVLEVVGPAIERLSKNTGLVLTFAISYGARREIVKAAASFAEECLSGKIRPEQLTEGVFSSYLWTSVLGELSDVDLMIRTSGEKRISNFLLWQCAYSELVFSDVCWPEFSIAHFDDAIRTFQSRKRRFGGVTAGPESRAPHSAHAGAAPILPADLSPGIIS